MISISEDELPRYAQIAKDLLDKIRRGEIKKDSKLKTELQLAEEYGVSRNTIRHAIGILERDNYLKRIVGKGTYVISDYEYFMTNQWVMFSIDDLNEVTKKTIIKYDAGILIEKPKLWVISDLDLQRWNKVWFYEGTKFVNDKPVSLVHVYLPYEIGYHPNFQDAGDLKKITIIQEQLGIELTQIDQHLSAEYWQNKNAETVPIQKGEPVVAVKRIYMHYRKPIEISVNYYPMNKFFSFNQYYKKGVKK